MSQTNNNSSITLSPLLNDYNDIIADGNNFVIIQCRLYYVNNQNINITGILNLQGDNGDLQTRNIDLSPSTNGFGSDIMYSFKVTSTSPGLVTYKVFANTSIGNSSVNSVKINFLQDTPQNQKIVVSSGAINNRLSTQPQTPAPTPAPSLVPTLVPTSTNDSIKKPSQCPQPCPQPFCPTCPTPSCPACPACPTANCPVNTNSSLAGSTGSQKCEIDYTPIIIIGVLIIILLIILLYLQLTNNK